MCSSDLQYGDRIVRLDKRGRGVLASYEVVRRMSVDMLRVHLRRMGERLGRDLDARLAHVLAYGDSSGATTAPVVVNTATANTWDYGDLMQAFVTLSLGHYFTPTHLLASADTLMQVLGFEAFQNTALFDFAQTGRMPSPLGLKLVPMAGQPDNLITLMDAGYAVQKLTEQDLLVESDKLIHQQWDRSYLTVVTDFAVVYDKARVVIKSDWT